MNKMRDAEDLWMDWSLAETVAAAALATVAVVAHWNRGDAGDDRYGSSQDRPPAKVRSGAEARILPDGTMSVTAIGFDDDAVRSLARLKKLERLVLAGVNTGAEQGSITDEGLAHVGRLVSLRHLELNINRRITDRGIASLGALPLLTTLRIRGVQFSAAGFRAMAKRLPSLRDLEVGDFKKLDSEGLRLLGRLEQLRHLGLRGLTQEVDNRGRGRRPSAVVVLKKMPNLRTLHMSRHPRFTPAIAAEIPSTVETLQLQFVTKLSDAGIQDLLARRTYPWVTPQVREKLEALPNLRQLETAIPESTGGMRRNP